MTKDTNKAPVTVTQEDRDAAADYSKPIYGSGVAQATREGISMLQLSEAFAGHRLNTDARMREALALVERIAKLALVSEIRDEEANDDHDGTAEYQENARDCAADEMDGLIRSARALLGEAPPPAPLLPGSRIMGDDNIAFTVHGFGVSAAQRSAGLAAMVGTFTGGDVRHAMAKAGVKDLPGQSYTVERATDRLLQSERKARRIRIAKGKGRGAWEKIA